MTLHLDQDPVLNIELVDPDPKKPWKVGSRSEMTWQVGSGSDNNSFGYAILIFPVVGKNSIFS